VKQYNLARQTTRVLKQLLTTAFITITFERYVCPDNLAASDAGTSAHWRLVNWKTSHLSDNILTPREKQFTVLHWRKGTSCIVFQCIMFVLDIVV